MAMSNMVLMGCVLAAAWMARSVAGGGPVGALPSIPPGGEAIFMAECALCHGRDGKLGLAGAKDLTRTGLSNAEMITLVTNGKGGMIGFGKTLSPKQIEEVVDHVRTLHKADSADN